MTAPQLAKNWTVTPNVRQAYVSLIGLAGWYAYQNKAALLTATWSHVWSCDGTTGPTNSSDHTDRVTSAANFATRATIAGAAQSWFVLANGDGVQMLFTYQGASDDILRVSFSPAGLFTLAGTTNQQPTATDEIIVSAATTIVNGTTSQDRVMSIWATTDARNWRCVLFRQSTLISGMSIGAVTRIAGAGTFPVAYVGSNFIAFNRFCNVQSTPACNSCTTTNAIGSAGYRGYMGRIFTSATSRACRMAGGAIACGVNVANANALNSSTNFAFASLKPASLAGTDSPTWPIILWGETTANFDGPWGVLIDWSQMLTNDEGTPALGTFVPGFDPADVPGVSGGQTGVGDVRTNWLIAIGAAAIWPWRNAAVSMEIL